jgi:methyl-accepting chemotaxis protein
MATRMGNPRGRVDEETEQQWRALALLAVKLRVNQEQRALLAQVLTAAPAVTGFQSVAIFWALPGATAMELVAETGMTSDERAHIAANPLAVSHLMEILKPDFALHAGRAYRLRPAQLGLVAGFTRSRPTATLRGGDAWTPADTLLIPLRPGATGPLLGLLALDHPADPKRVSEATIEIVEALGDLLVAAQENAQLYLGADRARRSLESGVTEIMRQVEQARRGNFTVRLPIRDSFLGVIADLFNEMVQRIGETLHGMREASHIVNESAAEVGALTAAATRDAQAQAGQIAAVSEAIISIAAALEAMAGVSVDAAAVAEMAREFSSAGRLAVEDAVRGMEGVRESALQSTQKVKRLAESLQEIESIVQQVADFTARTNLLALNASIEAGRAGDFGRGFAVIAHEIRTLAMHSADAAHQIATRIRGIQGEASVVVEAIGDGTEKVVEQSDRVTDAGTALQAIAEVTQQIADLNDAIRASAGVESRRTADLALAMNDILRITETMRNGVGQIGQAMARLIDLAYSLRDQITQFALSGGDRSAALLDEPLTQAPVASDQ